MAVIRKRVHCSWDDRWSADEVLRFIGCGGVAEQGSGIGNLQILCDDEITRWLRRARFDTETTLEGL